MGKGGLYRAVRIKGTVDAQRLQKVEEIAKRHWKKGYTALEVGCNDGTFADLLTRCGYSTVAVDIAPAVQVSQAYALVIADASNVGFHRNFDLVHMGEVLEHVKDPDVVMDNIVQYAKGLVIVSLPDFLCKGHRRAYSEESARAQVDSYIDIEYFETLKGRKRGRVFFLYGQVRG